MSIIKAAGEWLETWKKDTIEKRKQGEKVEEERKEESKFRSLSEEDEEIVERLLDIVTDQNSVLLSVRERALQLLDQWVRFLSQLWNDSEEKGNGSPLLASSLSHHLSFVCSEVLSRLDELFKFNFLGIYCSATTALTTGFFLFLSLFLFPLSFSFHSFLCPFSLFESFVE